MRPALMRPAQHEKGDVVLEPAAAASAWMTAAQLTAAGAARPWPAPDLPETTESAEEKTEEKTVKLCGGPPSFRDPGVRRVAGFS